MRSGVGLLLAITLGLADTIHDPRKGAAEVAQAVRGHDAPSLRALVRSEDFEPWMVVDVLCGQGDTDAALALAHAAAEHSPFPEDVAHLAGYAESRRGKQNDGTELDRFHVARKLPAPAAYRELTGINPKDEPLLTIQLIYRRALLLQGAASHKERIALLLDAGRRAREVGWIRMAGIAFNNAAQGCVRVGDFEAALDISAAAIAIETARGDPKGLVHALSTRAAALSAREDLAAALELFRELVERSRALGMRQEESTALTNLGSIHARHFHDEARAMDCYRDALAIQTALGNSKAAAVTRVNMGFLLHSVGDERGAVELFESAMVVLRGSDDTVGLINLLNALSLAYADLGHSGKAVRTATEARDLAQSIGYAPGEAKAALTLGGALLGNGDHEGAEGHLQAARQLYANLNNTRGLGAALVNLARLEDDLGDSKAALELTRLARAAHTKAGDHRNRVVSHYVEFRILAGRGERGPALEALRLACDLAREMCPGTTLETRVRAQWAWELAIEGECGGALAIAQDCLETARESADVNCQIVSLCAGSAAHRGLGDLVRARDWLRETLPLRAAARHEMSDELAGMTRARFHAVDVEAIEVCAALGDMEGAYGFVEWSKAGALLDLLSARHSGGDDVLPPGLSSLEAECRVAESAAMRTLQRAFELGDRARIKDATSRLRDARKQRAEAAGRIESEAKRVAGLRGTRVTPLQDLRKCLGPKHALVSLVEGGGDAWALLVTTQDVRLVNLGDTEAIDKTLGSLRAGVKGGSWEDARQRLSRLVVAPLGIPSEVSRVYVSAAGTLWAAPWALLLEGAECVLVPSATVFDTLASGIRKKATGVLALGPSVAADGDGGGGARSGWLAQLPRAGGEASVVGTLALLGEEATEEALRTHAAARPWRAIHLAGHGFVDMARPRLSTLPLTPAGEDDGLLGIPDIQRMRLRTDLVVLSACRTGLGKVVEGEGVIGFTRAFMFAGAPRVIVSLWRVDDEATEALMVKFYELWNPGDPDREPLPAATALKQAQEFIRDRADKDWSHPYYWAAWQLWGLGD